MNERVDSVPIVAGSVIGVHLDTVQVVHYMTAKRMKQESYTEV